jgi:hypothetical protein
MSFKVDVDTRAYMNAMKLLGQEVLPEVVAETLNQTAEAVTKESLRNVKKRMIVRTKFTINSLTRAGARPYRALNKARGRNVQRMFSRAGSISPYLGIQDTGGVQRPESGQRVPIPTLQARTGRSIQKSIARRYNLGSMGNIGSDGRFFIGTPKGGGRPLGLYERYQGGKRLRMIRNLESAQVTVPASRWHRDAAEEMGNQRFIRARFKRRAQQRLQRMSNRRR